MGRGYRGGPETSGAIPISIQCWQGDDVGGFESAGGLTGGGIMATGNYPGRARNADELGPTPTRR